MIIYSKAFIKYFLTTQIYAMEIVSLLLFSYVCCAGLKYDNKIIHHLYTKRAMT